MTKTSTTAPPIGITELPAPCWELVYADSGKPWDSGDISPHFDDQASAESMVESRDGDDEPPLGVCEREAPCFTATAACGLPFEDDGGSVLHWPTAEEALDETHDCRWPVVDGTLRCEDGDNCQPVTSKEGL